MCLCCLRHYLRICGIKHILNENSVTRGGIIYENVRDSAHELAVLDDGRARHECGQEGTTVFYGLFTNCFQLT